MLAESEPEAIGDSGATDPCVDTADGIHWQLADAIRRFATPEARIATVVH